MTIRYVEILKKTKFPIKNEFSQYIVTGFGFTEHGADSDVMLKIFVPKVQKETCQSFHRSIALSEGHECYGGEGVTDSCKGLTN